MPHVEEKDFTIRLEIRCEFPDDYQGDDDGYAWFESFPPVAAEAVRAVLATLAKHPGWKVRPTNRGRSQEEEVTLLVERTP